MSNQAIALPPVVSRKEWLTDLRDGDVIFHTYSTYTRGADLLGGTYNWLDLTPLGRQEDWEKPKGRSDGPMMSGCTGTTIMTFKHNNTPAKNRQLFF